MRRNELHRDEMRRRPGSFPGWTNWLGLLRKNRWVLIAIAALIGGWLVLKLLLSLLGVVNQYLNVPLCLLAGAAGYAAAGLWLQPVRRALDLLYQAAATAFYEANLIENQHGGGRRLEDRQEACRRLAAELAAAHAGMPGFCRALLRGRGQDALGASRALFLLAASQDDDEAWGHLQRVMKCLGISTGEREQPGVK